MLVKLNVIKTEEEYELGSRTHIELESRLQGEYIELRSADCPERFVWLLSGELLGAVKALSQAKT